MALFFTQGLRYFVSRRAKDDEASGFESAIHLGAVPILASPVNPDAYKWLYGKTQAESSTGPMKRSYTVAHFEDEHTETELAGRIFRKQHSANSLELFFDLFFVANLAVFTDNQAHVDALSVANYIGFFTILWSTWFHISIYDVRFYMDSVFSRLCKLVQFGIMTAFIGLGQVYSTIMIDEESRSFQDLGLVLMGFRFMLCVQYAVVLYFVYGFKKTFVPLSLMIGIYFLSAIAFLVVFLEDRGITLVGEEGASHVARWYIIIGIEAILVILVSSVWRVLSFQHTHLGERVGLLTLIITGEGILGLTKVIAYILMGTLTTPTTLIGLIAAAVALIYFVYSLYFDQVDHDRMGSVRQQIWALSHYPLHVAILLTVEGSTSMMTWAACRSAIIWLENTFPNPSNPTAYGSTSALLGAVNETLKSTSDYFIYASLPDYYNATPDIVSLQNESYTGMYGTQEWNQTVGGILNKMKYGVEYFLFNNYQAEGPEEAINQTEDYEEKVQLLNGAFQVSFEYFFVASGCFLIVLGMMYWFGKNKKDVSEWGAIVLRFLCGAALACVSAVGFLETPGDTTSYRYTEQGWIISITTFIFLAVLVGDNIIKIVCSLVPRLTHKTNLGSDPEKTGGRHNKLAPLTSRGLTTIMMHSHGKTRDEHKTSESTRMLNGE